MPESIGPVHFNMLGWSGPATAGERELLRALRGPFLMWAAAQGGYWRPPGNWGWPPWVSIRAQPP